MDSEQALKIIIEKLEQNASYYSWESLGKNNESAWLFRIPRKDLEGEEWLKNMPCSIVHICNPVKFLEAIKSENREESITFTGYVLNGNNQIEDENSLICQNCKTPMPIEIAKLGIVLMKQNK